jgi:hypothetical protein
MRKAKLDAKETVFQYNEELNNEFEFDYLRLIKHKHFTVIHDRIINELNKFYEISDIEISV